MEIVRFFAKVVFGFIKLLLVILISAILGLIETMFHIYEDVTDAYKQLKEE